MRIYKLFLLGLILSVVSCVKKDSVGNSAHLSSEYPSPDFLQKAKDYLRPAMGDSSFHLLDFDQAAFSEEDTTGYVRIGFSGNSMSERFLLLAVNSAGKILDGRVIELNRDHSDPAVYNGSILINSLSGELLSNNEVVNGFMVDDRVRQPGDIQENAAVQYLVPAAPVQELPEVIVVGYVGGGGGLSLGDYLYLSGLIGSGSGLSAGGGNVGGSPAGGGSGGSSGGVGSTPAPVIRPAGGSATYTPVVRSAAGRPITVSIEDSYSKPGVNVSAYLKCFSSIPDAGANYSVSLYVDLPVNDDPTMVFNMYTGSVGHVFLGLTKTNGSQSVTQYMGFTSTKPLASLVGVNSIAGKVVDNSGHKFNATMAIPVTGSQFSIAMNTMSSLSGSNYNLTNFNCVDFALSVINSFQPTSPIIPVLITPPGSSDSQATPEGLYITLLNMEKSPNSNIVTGNIWNAGVSHGSCN